MHLKGVWVVELHQCFIKEETFHIKAQRVLEEGGLELQIKRMLSSVALILSFLLHPSSSSCCGLSGQDKSGEGEKRETQIAGSDIG